MMWWPIVIVPDRGPGRDRGGVLPPRRAHRAAVGLGGDRRQRPAGHLPAPARRRAASRRDHPLQPGVRTAGVRAAAGLPRRRHGPAGRGAAPRRPPPARRGGAADALPQPPASARSPRSTGAATPASTCSTASTRGTTSPPASCWPGWRCPASWRSSPRPRSASPAPLLDLLLAQDADPRVPVLALIDARLAAGETDGWHYDDLPEDAQAWRDTLRSPRRGRPAASSRARLRAPDQRRASGPDPGRPGPRYRRREPGTTGRPPTCGACGPATPAPRSTPTRGPGTRSASPARPTPAATSTPASTPANTGRSPTAAPRTATPTRSRSPPASNRPAASTTRPSAQDSSA